MSNTRPLGADVASCQRIQLVACGSIRQFQPESSQGFCCNYFWGWLSQWADGPH